MSRRLLHIATCIGIGIIIGLVVYIYLNYP